MIIDKLNSILEIAHTARTRVPVFRYSHEICCSRKPVMKKSKIKESRAIRRLYLKVRPSSTLEILPECICHSIFLKSGSFLNLQCEFTLYSRPLIDVSIYTLKLHIWSITHISPEPVLTLWHRRNAIDGGGQHLSWIWRPVNLQRHTPPPPFAASDADNSPARRGFTVTWWASGWRYTIRPIPSHPNPGWPIVNLIEVWMIEAQGEWSPLSQQMIKWPKHVRESEFSSLLMHDGVQNL